MASSTAATPMSGSMLLEGTPSMLKRSIGSAVDNTGPWRHRYVLSLDGGGVKGYATLLILQRLMKFIELEESRVDELQARLREPFRKRNKDETKSRAPPSSNAATAHELTESQHEHPSRESLSLMATQEQSRNGSVFDSFGNSSSRRTQPTRLRSRTDEYDDNGPFEEMEGYNDRGEVEEPDDIRARKGDRQPCLYFDFMFGTSTGGLIAIMLGRLRMSVPDTLKVYEDMAQKVFGAQRFFNLGGLARDRYDHIGLETAIKTIVNMAISRERGELDAKGKPHRTDKYCETAFNSDPAKCRTVCVAYHETEDQRQRPYLFRSYDNFTGNHVQVEDGVLKDENLKELRALSLNISPGRAHTGPLWQVARATSAAFPFFKAMKIGGEEFWDGGTGYNNPANIAYEEVILMHNCRKSCMKMLLSIGTGLKDESQPMKRSWRIRRFLRLVKHGVKQIVQTEGTHEQMKVKDKSNEHSDQRFYYRFNPPREVGLLAMDKWRHKDGKAITQEQIKTATWRYLNREFQDERLRKIAKELVAARRTRESDSSPHYKAFASDVRHRCPVVECDDGHQKHYSREELEDHVELRHREFIDNPAYMERLIQESYIEA